MASGIKNSLHLFIIFNIYTITRGLNVLVSTPFDPWRLECPNKHAVLKMQFQRIESVGGIRTDNMLTVFCESLAKTFPSNRDETSQPFEEKCKWTKPIVIPSVTDMKAECGKREYLAGIAREALDQFTFLCCMVTDRKRDTCDTLPADFPTVENPVVLLFRPPQIISGIGVRNGKLTVEFCTYAVLSQKEIDEEFIATAKAKLNKWFEAQQKNQTAILKAKGKTIPPPDSDENSKESEDELNRPADFRTHNKVLPVVKSNGQLSVGSVPGTDRPAVGPPGFTPDANQAARFGIILSTKSTRTSRPPESNELLTPVAADRQSVNKVTQQASAETGDSDAAGITAATSTRKAAVASSTTKKPATTVSSAKSSTKHSQSSSVSTKSTQKSSTVTVATTKPTSKSTVSKSTTKKSVASSAAGTKSSPVTTTSTKKTSVAATATTSHPTVVSSRMITKPSSPKTTRFATVSISSPKSSTSPDPETSGENPIDNENDPDSDVLNVPAPQQPSVDPLSAFPRLPLHREDLARFNSLQPKGINVSVSDLSGGLSKFNPAIKGDENDVVYVDRDQSTTPDSDKPADVTATDTVEYYYYYEDGEPASAKPVQKLPEILSKLTINPPETTTFVSEKSQTATSHTSTSTVATTTTQIKVQEPVVSKSVSCDTNRAATNSITGLIIACGQNDEIWVPFRCPQGTFCLVSTNSNFRVCCPD